MRHNGRVFAGRKTLGAMKTCLIVDDSEVMREIAARLAAEFGCETRETDTAGGAVAACALETPTIMLLDWDLPNFGALDVLKGVAAFEPAARPIIVLVAAENDHQQFALARAAGAAHRLLKPFDRQALAEVFAEAGVIDAADAAAPASAPLPTPKAAS